jgi:two-component system cell cycle sensor histidine kinase/response regulator CckA
MSTVLVVDDRATNREIARAAIDQGGHSVIEASDGNQALAMAQGSQPDVIVVDVLMPGMDGYEFVHRLRGLADTADIPVVFYTANFSADELAPVTLTHGVSKVVLKSAQPAELLNAVDEAIHDHPMPTRPADATSFALHHTQAIKAKLVEKTRALDDSDARFTTMAEGAPIGIVIGDVRGCAEYVNPMLCTITGFAADDLLGEGWLCCLGPDGQRDVQSRIESGARTDSGAAVSADMPRYHDQVMLPNSLSRWLTVLVRSVRDSEDIHIGFVAMVDDVTGVIEAQERGLAEEREREIEARRQVTERFDSLARLAGETAHDLNNLINIVLGYEEFTTESVAEATGEVLTDARGSTILDHLGEIRVAGQRAGRLAHQLLEFGGREVVKPAIVDVNALVAEVGTMVGHTIGQNIVITTRLDAGLRHVLADASQLRQVLLNLAANAGDAMHDGGNLQFETTNISHREDTPWVTLVPGDYVHIAVTDDGHGMPPEIVQHALEPFFTTKPRGQGRGLGLATSYGVIRQAGGSLVIDSAPGNGTTIDLYLPVAKREIDVAVPAVPATGAEGQTILVAEDEEGVRDVVTFILRKAGYQILAGANGEEALAAAERHNGKIDALLTDIVMPRMNGRQLAIAFGRKWPHAPILYMSGYAAPIMTAQGLIEPGVTVLGKPFTRVELLAAIRETLHQIAR